MNGSSISYTPPTGTNHVKYEFHFQASYYSTSAPLYHLKFYYDGTEVTHGRMSQYMYYDDRKHYVMALSLNNSSPSIAAGKIGTWNTAKVMKIQVRSYTTSYRPDVHSTHYFNGGGSRQFVRLNTNNYGDCIRRYIMSYEEPVQEYKNDRMMAYPSVGDQLDMLWHAIDANETLKTQFADFYNAIRAVKDAHPKVE